MGELFYPATSISELPNAEVLKTRIGIGRNESGLMLKAFANFLHNPIGSYRHKIFLQKIYNLPATEIIYFCVPNECNLRNL